MVFRRGWLGSVWDESRTAYYDNIPGDFQHVCQAGWTLVVVEQYLIMRFLNLTVHSCAGR